VETVDLETILSGRATRWQRLLRALPILAVILLVVAFAAYAIVWPPAGPTVRVSPALTVNPLVMTNVTFGTLRVNGTLVRGNWPISVRLRQGRNVFRVDAPPFLPRSCSLPWPLDLHLLSGPSGSYARDGSAPPPPRALGSDACAFTWASVARAITSVQVELPLTGADLPPAQRDAALAAVAQALANGTAPTTTVASGDYYAAGRDTQGQTTAAVAAAPLVEWPTLAPDVAGDYVAGPCGDLSCAGAYEFGALAPRSATWNIGEAVHVTLHFATQAHRVVSVVQMPLGVAVMLTLVLGADGTWTAALNLPTAVQSPQDTGVWPLPNPCVEGAQLLRQRLRSAGMVVAPQNAVGVDGYLLEAESSQQGVGGSTTGVQAGHFLWRFGVLLALAPPDEAAISG
jgi:hypothetical protein